MGLTTKKDLLENMRILRKKLKFVRNCCNGTQIKT